MGLKNSPISKSYKIRVGITIGDPAGIGPEVTLKAILRLKYLANFVVVGDNWVLEKIKNQQPEGFRKAQSKIKNYKLIDLDNVPHRNFSFGKIRAEYGRASIEYLNKALELIKNREIDCLVTCPISKLAVNLGGFNKFIGHTEYLAKQTNTKNFVMMLLNKYLKISLVTRHTPLKNILSELSKDKLYKTIFVTHQSLKKIFLIKNPRIVVCGLNPHASDNGLIGKEEIRIIKPVLKSIKNIIRRIDGPFSADVAFLKAINKLYDCVVAMYHDQALIALKLLDIKSGTNITLGLPFIRTSPLHGTAFDLAGNNLADPSSLIEAIKLAIKCTLNLRRA